MSDEKRPRSAETPMGTTRKFTTTLREADGDAPYVAQVNRTIVDRIIAGSGRDVFSPPVDPDEISHAEPMSLPWINEREQALQQEIAGLRRQLSERGREIRERRTKGAALEDAIAELKSTLLDLQRKETLSFVLDRIHERAHQAFLESAEFQNDFLSGTRAPAYVMAVDLRRSTELMLKSRTAELFAHFITELCAGLRAIVLEHHGVFDKFTGDGILAFFPDFYSGSDAGYFAIQAASRCHTFFAQHYRAHHKSFHTVLKEVGLGIGIDFGEAHLVRVGRELAIVGTPVVYACRMAEAEAGTTLLNQPAYEQTLERFSAYCSLDEADLTVKHEGTHLAHAVRLNAKPYSPTNPGWTRHASASTTHRARTESPPSGG